ncbi:ALDH-like protein, partial [Aspergillus novofumigatus IBT 16806]
LLNCLELVQSLLPPGVVQVLADVNDPGIAHISFTGSSATGKNIMYAAAKTLKWVALELGGHNAAIILPDVDIEKVARPVAMGTWWTSGQSCVAVKRVYIDGSIYERFMRAPLDFARSQFTVGCSGVDGATVMGLSQNKMQYQKLRELIESCRREGCTISLDEPHTAKDDLERQSLESGFFLWPTIVDNPPADSPLVSEERFGGLYYRQVRGTRPIIPCMPSSDIDAVIAAANSTSTGLSASVWGKHAETTQRIADSLDVGTVFVDGPSRPDPRVPFSGRKETELGSSMD